MSKHKRKYSVNSRQTIPNDNLSFFFNSNWVLKVLIERRKEFVKSFHEE